MGSKHVVTYYDINCTDVLDSNLNFDILLTVHLNLFILILTNLMH